MEDAVKNGAVTFDKADLSEGTVASVKCTNGGELEGASKLRCVGGLWDSEIPQCLEPVAAPVAAAPAMAMDLAPPAMEMDLAPPAMAMDLAPAAMDLFQSG